MDSSPNPSMRYTDDDNGNADSEEKEDGSFGRPPPSDRELMRLMMARLAIMEQQVKIF
jgi:hypothetical protein